MSNEFTKSFTVKVPQDAVVETQKADIEQSARREIIVSCIERGVANGAQAFTQYQNEYNEWYVKFMTCKSDIERKYVRPNVPAGYEPASWNLDYNTNTLLITCTRVGDPE